MVTQLRGEMAKEVRQRQGVLCTAKRQEARSLLTMLIHGRSFLPELGSLLALEVIHFKCLTMERNVTLEGSFVFAQTLNGPICSQSAGANRRMREILEVTIS